jgi:hypothetical protein
MSTRILPLSGVAILLCACASTVQRPDLTAAASPAAAVAPKPPPATYDAAELDRRARQMGYHVVMRNDDKRYCQYGAPVGSHITSMHCLSPAMMAQAAREDEELQDKLSRRGNQLCPSCVQKN